MNKIPNWYVKLARLLPAARTSRIRIDQNRFFPHLVSLSIFFFFHLPLSLPPLAGSSIYLVINLNVYVREPSTHKSLILAVNDIDRTFESAAFSFRLPSRRSL